MKKVMTVVLMALVLIGAATAAIYETKWSLRGNVKTADVGATINGIAISQVIRGEVNAYASIDKDGKRYKQTQGYIGVVAKGAMGEIIRHTINWHTKGNKYGTTLISDTATETTFKANAREVFWASGPTVTYGIPIEVVYHKDTNKLDIKHDAVIPDFQYTGVDVVDLIA